MQIRIDDFDMTTLNQDAGNESRIEKMKKFLSSPLTRKKPSGSQTKTFGTSLDVLIQRTPSEAPVPYIVTRICQYIENTGLLHEGLFRISGNARLIERLKLCFDQTGDAPLETEGDVASAAALLKLFLRELPEPIIPLSMHQQFLNAVKGSEKSESVNDLMLLVEKLPFPNFSLLKYLSYFLMQVSQCEEQNRMSASSLGIVFGPNLFRVAEDFVGLKEQSLTNQIVTYFITDYYAIFHTDPEHVVKPSRLVTSLDGSVKHNHISLDANHSMVSSWPKVCDSLTLSSFPSLMSSLNLRPLSVSIPMADSFPVNSNEELGSSEVHILMVDDTSEDSCSITGEQIPEQNDKDEMKGGTSSLRRKRKERKLVKEDVLASYSTLQSMSCSAPSGSSDMFMDAKNMSHTQVTTDSHTEILPHHLNPSHADSGPSQYSGYLLKPMGQETEIMPAEPLLDPQKSMQCYHAENDICAHEAQRNVERTTLHISPQRSRNSPKSTPSYIRTSSRDAVMEVKPGASSDYPHKTSFVEPSCSTLFAPMVSNHMDNNSKNEVTEGKQFASISLEDTRPMEPRFSYDHKQHRSKLHRSHYYKKQQVFGESRRPLSSSQESPPSDKKELQLDGLKSSFDSENVTLVDIPTSMTEYDVSVDGSVTTTNGSNSDQRHTWPMLKWLHEGGDRTVASPANQFLKLSNSTEASLSPSAYRSYLSHRSPHLDPNLPPSPPVEQEDLASGVVDDANEATAKQLSKKIQSIKKKIKQFEESFEASHGYRPSLAEKSSHPEIKKLIRELQLARQELKQFREEHSALDAATAQDWSPASDSPVQKTSIGTNTCRFGACLGPILSDGASVTIEESLSEAMQYLDVKRKSSQRPDALEDMSREQIVEEKYTIQKLLLQFESIHGRPSSKTHRDLMRPLYDRYRNAKRILARSASFGSLSKGKDMVELQPILEHETMDFKPSKAETVNADPVSDVTVIEKNESEVDKEINSDMSLKVFLPVENHCKLKKTAGSSTKSHANLHELSLSELYEQQQHARAEKRRLRSVLRDFEQQFQKDHGRKVQREDKVDLEDVYGAYKNVRARLKLLEALAAKHGQKK